MVSSPRWSLLALAPLAVAGFSAVGSAQDPAPGHRIYSPTGTPAGTFMVDDQGNTIHTWASPKIVGNTVYVEPDGTLLRAVRTGVAGPGGVGGGVERVALDGTVLWEFEYDTGGNIHHHDVESMPNGNVLMIAWEQISQADAIAAGRDPGLVTAAGVMPDHIIEVQPTGPTTGDIVWEWHVWDHLIQDFDATKDNFGDVGANPQLVDVNFTPSSNADWNHANSLDYDPVNDWILLSANFQDEIWIIDHSTTTAEAAGHTGGDHGKGGDLLWRWGNPQVYRAGGPGDQQLFRQHGVKFIDAGLPGAGHIILYNNQIAPSSRVEELELPLDGNGEFVFGPGGVYGPAAPLWTYQDPAMQSNIMSSAERLPNGNTLICSSLQGRLFEITTGGTIVWEIATPTAFRVSYVGRSFWDEATELSQAGGGSVAWELMAGSSQANQSYWVLGTISGTSPGFTKNGVGVPLNWDAYSDLTLALANTPVLTDTFATLDANGRASASLNVAPGLLPATAIGAVLDHVFVAFDPGTSKVTFASNADGFEIVP